MELGEYELLLATESHILDLDDIVPIHEDDISRDFIEQPSSYAYVAMLAARAEAEWLDAKRLLDEVYAETDLEVRRDLLADSDLKVTESLVKSEITLRRGYQEQQVEELNAHEEYLIMRAVVRAMEMRAQMLISLGAQQRAEQSQTGMVVKEVKDKLTSIRKDHSKKRARIDIDNDEEPPF